MEALKIGELKHVFLLAGAESYFIDRAREVILSRLFDSKSARNEGMTVLDCDDKIDLSEIISVIDTAPLFVEKNVVLQEDKGLLLIKTMLDSNYVIFTASEAPDKRKKIYKALDKVGAVLEAEPLRSYQLEPWLNDKLKALKMTMDYDARQYFIGTAGLMPEVSLGLLDNELDKVSLYVRSNRITKAELEKVLASLPEISNFALMDAINEKNFGKAMKLLSMQNGEVKNVMITMTLLARHVRLLLRAKHFMSKGVRGKELGEASKKFSQEALEEALIDLADADFGLKTGTGGTELIEGALMKLLLS